MTNVSPSAAFRNTILRKTSALFKFLSAQIFAAFLLSTVSDSSTNPLQPTILHTVFLLSAAISTMIALLLLNKYSSYSLFIAVVCAISAGFLFVMPDIRIRWGFWPILVIHVFFGITVGLALFKTDQYLREALPGRWTKLRTIFYTFFVYSVQTALIWLMLAISDETRLYIYSFYVGIVCSAIFGINFTLKRIFRSNNRLLIKESWYACYDCHKKWLKRKRDDEFEWCYECQAEIFNRFGIRPK